MGRREGGEEGGWGGGRVGRREGGEEGGWGGGRVGRRGCTFFFFTVPIIFSNDRHLSMPLHGGAIWATPTVLTARLQTSLQSRINYSSEKGL